MTSNVMVSLLRAKFLARKLKAFASRIVSMYGTSSLIFWNPLWQRNIRQDIWISVIVTLLAV